MSEIEDAEYEGWPVSRSGRNTMRCESGKCCCRPDHTNRCSPRAAGKEKVRKEINEEVDRRREA